MGKSFAFPEDPQLPILDQLLSDEFNQRIRRHWPACPPDLQVDSIRYKPSTSCLISFRRPNEIGSTVTVKAYTAADWAQRQRNQHHPGSPTAFDDELAITINRFPYDSVLPIFDLIENPTGIVSHSLYRQFANDPLVEIKPVSYKPHRRLSCFIKLQSGRQAVIKLHDPSSFIAALSAARHVKHAKLTAAPSRLGRSHRHHTLTHQWIDGKPLSGEPGLESLSGVENQLIRLSQAISVPAKKPIAGMEHWGHRIRSMSKYVSAIAPPLSSLAKQVSEDLLRTVPRYLDRIVHGDFHLNQLVQTENGLAAVDFDRCKLGTASFDLANLISDLQLRAMFGAASNGSVMPLAELLARHFHDRDLAVEFEWNRAATLFQLVTHPFRRGRVNWIAETEALLKEVRQRLQKPLATRTCTNNHLHKVQSARMVTAPPAISSDVRLRFLSAAFQSDAESIIRQHAPELEHRWGSFRLQEATLHRHRPGRRAMLRLDLETEQGPAFVLGKASAKRLDRQTPSRIKTLIEQAGFSQDAADGIHLPKPLGIVEPWNLWLQEGVDAQPGNQLLESGQLANFMPLVARAIHKLHQSPPIVDRAHSVEAELDILQQQLTSVAQQRSDVAGRIRHLLDACTRLIPLLTSSRRALIHRDFYQDQFLIAGDRIFLVDLDLLCQGDPAIDLGNFMAHLAEHGLRTKGNSLFWRDEELSFLETSLALNPQITCDEVLAWKAISFARHIGICWRIPTRRHLLERIVSESQRLVASQLNLLDSYTHGVFK